MWDMMLMGGDPYGRRHRRGHRRSKTHRKCRACREPIGKVTLYGKRIDLPYCQKHHCQKVIGSTVCQEQRNGRNPNWQYCDTRKSRAFPCLGSDEGCVLMASRSSVPGHEP